MNGEHRDREVQGDSERQAWHAPAFEEIKMDAEIGAYQSDDTAHPPRD